MTLPDLSGAKIAFVHVPKTAGTSLTSVLAKGWGRVRIVAQAKEVDTLPVSEAQDLTLLSGHFFPYQLERECFRDFVPITVLRDPFARLLSSWRFANECVARGQKVGPAMAFAARVDFAEFAFSNFGAYERHTQIYTLGRVLGEPPQHQPLRLLLERAKARLEGMYVGTADRAEDFVAGLFRRFGRGDAPPVPRLNTTLEVDDAQLGLTRAQREAVMELLAPDYALLEHGRRLMEAQLASVPGA